MCIRDRLYSIFESLNFIPKDNPLYKKSVENIEIAKRQNEEFSAMVRDNFTI